MRASKKILPFLCWLCMETGAQFAYPVDSNPPQVSTTFSCFACSGENCGETRIAGTHAEESCSGPRVACWTIHNPVSGSYDRMCGQPASIRQGVFCNRHMENKEFCYAQGQVRLCAKCCLNDRCNAEPLQNIPDRSLQSCFACDGNNEDICNSEISLSAENSTYVEQCLLPGSDCWTQKTRTNENDVYLRGCQLRTCPEGTETDVCATNGNEHSCSTCCKGKLCNRFTTNGGTVEQAVKYFRVVCLVCMMVVILFS